MLFEDSQQTLKKNVLREIHTKQKSNCCWKNLYFSLYLLDNIDAGLRVWGKIEWKCKCRSMERCIRKKKK